MGEGETTGIKMYSFLLASVSFCSLALILIKDRVLRFSPPPVIFFILLILWMIISSFFSKDIAQTIWEILRTTSYFALFLTIYHLTANNKSAQRFLIISLTAIGAILLIKDVYYFFSWGGLRNGSSLIGTFYWHNQMAGFITFLIPLLLSLFLSFRNIFLKLITLSAIFISLISIVFTYSRGGWISLIAALLLFFILSFKKIKSNIILLFLMLAIFITATFVFIKPANVNNKAQSIKAEMSPQTRTVSGNLRITVWKNTLKMIKDYPIFGLGPGAFGNVYYNYQNTPWLYAQHAHNQFLEYIAELGILGFLFFAAIIISAIFCVFTNLKKLTDETKYPFLAGVIAALFGSGVHALIDIDWTRIALFSIFWILLAVLFANLTKKEKTIDIVGIKKLLYLPPLAMLAISIFLIIANRNYEMAQKNLEENKIQEAERNIVKAITLNPYESSSYILYGEIKEMQKKQKEAMRMYRKASALNSYKTYPYYKLGQIESLNKNYKQAKNDFLKAVQLAPFSDPKLYISLSDSYDKLGNIKESERVIRDAVENKFPINESYRGFSYIYDYTGMNKDVASLYFKLITFDIKNKNTKEAKKLLNIIEKDIDPKSPIIPFFKEFVIK